MRDSHLSRRLTLAAFALVLASALALVPPTVAMGNGNGNGNGNGGSQSCETYGDAFEPADQFPTDCVAECDRACGDLGGESLGGLFNRAVCECFCCLD